MADQIPEDSALFHLLAAALKLSEASAEVIARAHAPKLFDQDLVAFACAADCSPNPLDEALDLIADAVVELHRAGGDHAQTLAFAEAAAARLMGTDL